VFTWLRIEKNGGLIEHIKGSQLTLLQTSVQYTLHARSRATGKMCLTLVADRRPPVISLHCPAKVTLLLQISPVQLIKNTRINNLESVHREAGRHNLKFGRH